MLIAKNLIVYKSKLSQTSILTTPQFLQQFLQFCYHFSQIPVQFDQTTLFHPWVF